MKFQHLAIGARFFFEGKVHVKASPIAATTEAGGLRLIPRYAELEPVEGSVTASVRNTPVTLDAGQVIVAFEAYHAECLRVVAESGVGAALADSVLAAARQRFLDAIGLGRDCSF